MTLNVALTMVSMTVLVLSFFSVYLKDRTRYSAWWIGVLLMAAVSNAFTAMVTDANEPYTIPLANLCGVLSAACAWGASRALRHLRTGWRLALLGSAATLVATVVEGPSLGYWAGTLVTLLAMSGFFGLAAVDLWQLRRDHSGIGGRHTASGGATAVTGLAVAVSALASYYGLRAVLYAALGPEHPVFDAIAGVGANALALLVLLVVVTFTMTELSQVERVIDLQIRATLDSLTGLWNRDEFERRARARLARRHGGATVVVADLDRFKCLNDTHGHAAGDRALAAFGRTVRSAIAARDVAGRLGGEEFALVLTTDDADAVRSRLDAIREAYAGIRSADGTTMPTVSFGVAAAGEDEDLEAVLRRADAAMYRAKREGRDRIVVAAPSGATGASSQAA
ncbi:GGDEF domain-containing protein [Demequina gelatinilytica]|uniref:GGDEF domain-containing protein n=1 Tax=Demequina gelatinilytica TaxID=1638980 RepID=UPI0012E02FD7|nr:GGDEF domain-containing protein [Demequina gelatinilytica]